MRSIEALPCVRRVPTLRLVANDPRLFGCRLFFAQWGHSDAEQQALAASMPRVRTLVEAQELEQLMAARATGGDAWPPSDWREK